MCEITKFPTDVGTITRTTVWTKDKKLKLKYSISPYSLTFSENNNIYYADMMTSEWQNYTVFWDTSHNLTSIQQSPNYVGYKEVQRYQQVCTNGMMGWRTIGYDVTMRHLVNVINRIYFKITQANAQLANLYNARRYVDYYALNYDLNNKQKTISYNGTAAYYIEDDTAKYTFTESDKLSATNFANLPFNFSFDELPASASTAIHWHYTPAGSRTVHEATDLYMAQTLQDLKTNPTSIADCTIKYYYSAKPSTPPTYSNITLLWTFWGQDSYSVEYHLHVNPSAADIQDTIGGNGWSFGINLPLANDGNFYSFYWGFKTTNGFINVQKIELPINITKSDFEGRVYYDINGGGFKNYLNSLI